ncbi:hypothetical protein K438DRAFT_2002467 [Mycena galopus ATCC 62051]|nr:hypothetical protein K438DRAFT_2002467 [Mycena galopus ATCC 62051]
MRTAHLLLHTVSRLTRACRTTEQESVCLRRHSPTRFAPTARFDCVGVGIQVLTGKLPTQASSLCPLVPQPPPCHVQFSLFTGRPSPPILRPYSNQTPLRKLESHSDAAAHAVLRVTSPRSTSKFHNPNKLAAKKIKIKSAEVTAANLVVLITSTEPPHCPPSTPTGKDAEGGMVEQGRRLRIMKLSGIVYDPPDLLQHRWPTIRASNLRTNDEGGATPDAVEQMQKEALKEMPQSHLAAPALAMCACRTAQTAMHSLRCGALLRPHSLLSQSMTLARSISFVNSRWEGDTQSLFVV